MRGRHVDEVNVVDVDWLCSFNQWCSPTLISGARRRGLLRYELNLRG